MRRLLRYSILATVSLLLWTSCQMQPTSRATHETREATVERTLKDFAAAMSNSDAAFLGKVWADDFRFVRHDGEILTKEQLLELITSGAERFESLTLDNLTLRTYGDAILVVARSTQKATLDGKDHSGTATVSVVLVEGRDGWQMVLAQLSELKPLSGSHQHVEGSRSPNSAK